MPLINISILEGRSEEKIMDLIKNVTATVSETLDAPKGNIRVIVTEVPKNRWAVGSKTMKEIGR